MKNKFKFKLDKNTKLSFNPLSLMIKKADIPKEELPDSDYVIHHNFAGHPEYESSMRVEITADKESRDLLDDLIHLKVSSPEKVLKLKDLKFQNEEKKLLIVKVLIYTGFLTIVDQ